MIKNRINNKEIIKLIELDYIIKIDDIKLAVQTCRNVGNNDITILKCTSSYPAPIEGANLTMILNSIYRKDSIYT